MKLYRAFATVGGFTMLSRVLGFVRDILIAGVLGTGLVADAFFAAFRLPNLFRRLFAEGAFNAAFVPLFAKRLEGEGPAGARRFAEEALAALTFALLVFTALAELAMPWFIHLITPGFAGDAEKFDFTVLLTRITFPYLLCMSLVALYSGLLNALGRFTAAAAAPILLNAVLIATMAAAAFFGLGNTPEAGLLLAWGVALAGLLQLVMLLGAARRADFPLTLRPPRLTAGVRRLVRLGLPGVIAGGITQINIVIGTMIASLESGAIAFLYYADRLYQLPLGVIGIAVGVVLLPDVSRELRAGNLARVADSQNRALEFALLLTMPAAVALFAIPEPIIRVLFERGAFGPSDTLAVSAALRAFAVGLPAFVLIKVFSPAYFAREDTRTPMIYAGISMVVNVVGSLVLFFVLPRFGLMPHIGIAIATTLAGWVNTLLLWATLGRRGHFHIDTRLRRTLPLIALSSLVMGLTVWLAAAALGPWLGPGQALLVEAFALGGLIVLGVAIFGLALSLTGALKLGELTESLRQRQGELPQAKRRQGEQRQGE